PAITLIIMGQLRKLSSFYMEPGQRINKIEDITEEMFMDDVESEQVTRNSFYAAWAAPLNKIGFSVIGLFAGCLIFLHIMFLFNKTYSACDRDNCIENVDAEQYKLFVKSVPMRYRSQVVSDTGITYFGVVPQVVINIFYGLYFMVAVVGYGK